jgi:hypothetical protein
MKAFAAATELPRVSLSDALDLCVLLAESEDRRFEAAARRWLARFTQETHSSVAQIGMASAALIDLGAPGASEVARDILRQLLTLGQ